jgi:hypothetical protein
MQKILPFGGAALLCLAGTISHASVGATQLFPGPANQHADHNNTLKRDKKKI